jgi:oxygen-independent coproporphyrinogen-3 oxidase
MSQTDFSVYIHVPFCAVKCPYCDFNTYATKLVPEREYVDALLGELRAHATNTISRNRRVQTVFFGGGTPSLLSPDAIGEIIAGVDTLFGINQGAEVSIEANPSGMSRQVYQKLQAVGVNRLSFGVQSFDDKQLSVLGRDHSSAQAIRAVKEAREQGFEKLSIDLMLGVPEQAQESFRRDVEIAMELPIGHFSAYALSVEPGTPFFQRQERGLLSVPPDEDVLEMLEDLPELVATFGFSRYEISNYAKSGYESLHNTVYWKGGDYLGLGAGSHSFMREVSPEGKSLGGVRWSNVALPATYMQAVRDEQMISWKETLSQDALAYEFFYLGLRMMQGVSYDEFCSKFPDDIWTRYEDALVELTAANLIVVDQGRVALTERGVALSDSVFERLIVS